MWVEVVHEFIRKKTDDGLVRIEDVRQIEDDEASVGIGDGVTTKDTRIAIRRFG